MAFNSVLDEVSRIIDNEAYAQGEKLGKLFSLKRHFENWLEFVSTVLTDKDAVYLCDSSKLQLRRGKETTFFKSHSSEVSS